MHRSRKGRSSHGGQRQSAGKHAHYAPRLIGYAILAAAVLFIAIGIATAYGATVVHPWAA
jgi:hypothetical protein